MSAKSTISGRIIVGVLFAFVIAAGLLLLWGTMRAPIEVPSSGRFPRAIVAAAMPDPQSEGAQLVQKHCISCHALPDPAFHPAADWPASLADMELRIRTSIMKGAPMPSHAGWRKIEAYLEAHAKDAPRTVGANTP